MDPNIEQLTDERDVLEAQRDHYLEYCEELKTQVSERDKLLLGKLLTSLCEVDPSLFEGESLERLMKWKECVELCIKHEIKRLKVEGKKPLDGDREGEGKGEESEVNDGGREFETKLPLGHSNLVGLLTKNHKLTQGRTQYPEPRPKHP